MDDEDIILKTKRDFDCYIQAIKDVQWAFNETCDMQIRHFKQTKEFVD